jgi:hypothetical protein
MGSFSLCYFLVDTLVLARMVRWYHAPVAYRELLPVRASTYVVSIVNTQLAQGALGLYLHRRFGTPLPEVFGTVALLVLLEATQLVGLATIGLSVERPTVPVALFGVPLALATVWAAVATLARTPSAPGLLGRVARSRLLGTFRQARATQCLAVLGLKTGISLLSIFVHKAALGCFGIDIPLGRLVALLPIVYLLGALPVTVAHLGTSQAAWVVFFRDHAPEGELLAYSLAAHLTFMLANGSLGLCFLPKVYADLFGPRRGGSPRSRPAS